MKQEIGPLLQLVAPYRKESVGRYRLYRFMLEGREFCLAESGMGPAHAATATRLLIDSVQPHMIVNFGFCGGLTTEFRIGDLVLANRLLFCHDRLFSEQQGLAAGLIRESALILEAQAGIGHCQAAFVTTSRIMAKRDLASRLPAGIDRAVVEMETSAVAQVAGKEQVPLVAIRAVSDEADDELGFSLDEFCDGELNIRPWRVFRTVARKPWIIPQLIRLSGNSRRAGQRLAAALHALLPRLPLS